MFIGRERELSSLDRLYKSNKFEFAVIYGRRRVGKTALINEFVKGKDAICFTGVETNAKQSLENFSRCIFEFALGAEADTCFASFQAALEYVFKAAESKRLILVIDEYPYVARASKSFASTLQLLMDKYKDTSKLFLILCGSSMAYIEDIMLDHKSPLLGRITAQLKIQPFEFFEACKFFDNFKDKDKALAYGIAGGTPQYLLQLNAGLSVEENIKNMYLNPVSSIYEEPNNLLKQEVREPAIYNAIITAIASGASKMSEISAMVGEDTSICATYIKTLMTLEIIKKETPYGEKLARKTIYSIRDNMFRFWYRFVPVNISTISRGAADLVYKRIEPYLSDYMDDVFREICKQYLWNQLLNGKCAVSFTDLGRWWRSNHKTRRQEKIDIMGTSCENKALFAECKWTDEKVDSDVLDTLSDYSNLFDFTEKHFYLFAKTGFTNDCINKANEMGNVILVTYDDMINS